MKSAPFSTDFRVFDWVRAAILIRERHRTGNLKVAYAGLRNDWGNTAGKIFEGGHPVPRGETYTYLGSYRDIPELSLDGENLECWIWASESSGWGSGTYWPIEALTLI